ncbi:MAG: hypothetical protein HY270_21490 [Deltaproteobacteria bacterium]|nr:hypothetical protein [Deltaproteobacteria bacterium]
MVFRLRRQVACSDPVESRAHQTPSDAMNLDGRVGNRRDAPSLRFGGGCRGSIDERHEIIVSSSACVCNIGLDFDDSKKVEQAGLLVVAERVDLIERVVASRLHGRISSGEVAGSSRKERALADVPQPQRSLAAVRKNFRDRPLAAEGLPGKGAPEGEGDTRAVRINACGEGNAQQECLQGHCSLAFAQSQNLDHNLYQNAKRRDRIARWQHPISLAAQKKLLLSPRQAACDCSGAGQADLPKIAQSQVGEFSIDKRSLRRGRG